MLALVRRLSLVILWLLAGCRLIGPAVPCERDDNCPDDNRCERSVCVVPAPKPDLRPAAGGDAGPGALDDGGGGDDAGQRAPDGGPDDGGGPPAGDAGPPVGLVALYTFEEGSGVVVEDRGGYLEPLPLTISDPTLATWVDDGLAIEGAALVRSGGPADKITRACNESGELTVEAWVTPRDFNNTGPARVVTLSRGIAAVRSFTLGQAGNDWIVRLHTSFYAGNPGAHLARTAVDQVTLERQHLAFTYSAASGALLTFKDGVVVDEALAPADGLDWSEGLELGAGNEIPLGPNDDENRTWFGTLHRVAVHCRALSPAEIADQASVE